MRIDRVGQTQSDGSGERPKLASWVFDVGRFLATKDVLFHVFSHRTIQIAPLTRGTAVRRDDNPRVFCRSRTAQHDGARDVTPSMSRWQLRTHAHNAYEARPKRPHQSDTRPGAPGAPERLRSGRGGNPTGRWERPADRRPRIIAVAGFARGCMRACVHSPICTHISPIIAMENNETYVRVSSRSRGNG